MPTVELTDEEWALVRRHREANSPTRNVGVMVYPQGHLEEPDDVAPSFSIVAENQRLLDLREDAAYYRAFIYATLGVSQPADNQPPREPKTRFDRDFLV